VKDGILFNSKLRRESSYLVPADTDELVLEKNEEWNVSSHVYSNKILKHSGLVIGPSLGHLLGEKRPDNEYSKMSKMYSI
jgi:hypothetical protein